MLQRVDDETVSDNENLLRRIWNQDQWMNLKLMKSGEIRPSSVAFTDENDEVSVFVATQKTTEEALEGFPDFGLVSIEAGVPRRNGLIVAATPEDPDPAHRAICNPPIPDQTSGRKAKARKMAEAAKWIVYPLNYRAAVSS
jgi:hypothetical protein